jgi:hypothetical protein
VEDSPDTLLSLQHPLITLQAAACLKELFSDLHSSDSDTEKDDQEILIGVCLCLYRSGSRSIRVSSDCISYAPTCVRQIVTLFEWPLGVVRWHVHQETDMMIQSQHANT